VWYYPDRMRSPVRTIALQAGAALLSGALLPLCFPPFDAWPLMLVVLALLVASLRGAGARWSFYLGMLQGLTGFGLALRWLWLIFGPAALALFALMAMFTGFFCLAHHWLARPTHSAAVRALMAATLWTAFEFFRSELFFLRFPWITPGTALGPTWLSPWVGVYGATFVVVVAAAAIAHRAPRAWTGALLVIVAALGVFRPGPVPLPAPDEGISVTIVQNESCSLPTYLSDTRTAGITRPGLIVWPEYALAYDVRKDARDLATLTNLCRQLHAVLIVGTRTEFGPGPRDWHNTALTMDAQGVVGEYYKARPVHFFDDGRPGVDLAPVQTAHGRIGTPICFDCDYTEVARRLTARGAEFFAVPSCDPEYWSATQHLQHAMLFRLRAAENGRWLACAASSGVSQFVDPHGNVRASLPPLVTGTLSQFVRPGTELTFFTRAGWLFPWLVSAGALSMVANALIRMLPRRRARH
jgi:apolipoprotein N-acyltransferase